MWPPSCIKALPRCSARIPRRTISLSRGGCLRKKLQYVDAALADKQWLTGHRFTIADGYLFTVLRWAYAIKLDMAAYGHIGSWMTQVAARPAVAAALAAEGLK